MRELPEGAESKLSQTSRSEAVAGEGSSHGGSGQGRLEPRPEGSRPRLWVKILPETAALALCLVLWIPTKEFTSSVGGPGPAMYPRILIALFAIAMVVRMVQQLRENRAEGVAGHTEHEAALEEGVEFDESLIDSRRVWVAIGFSILYVLSTLFLGWTFATLIFTVVFLLLAGKRNPLFIVPTALVFAFGFSYVFVKVVYISLPTGVGVFDLITVRLFELMGIY